MDEEGRHAQAPLPTRRSLCTRRIASTEASTSVSLVVQFETEMRIAATPCHTVPPEPAGAVALHPVDDRAGAVVGLAEADEHLVEHDVVEDVDLRLGREPIGEPARHRAVLRDTGGDTSRPSARMAA